MSRIIFLNRFFYPDHSATSQILGDLAFALAAGGREVHIVTSRQRYDDASAGLARHEQLRGVTVHRVWTSHFGRSNLVGRTIDYLSFYLSAAWSLLRLTGRGDLVVAKTDPPLLSVIVAPIVWLKRARLINWLQDLFPEVAQALGFGQGRFSGLAMKLLRIVRNWSLKAASGNVVLGTLMAQRLRDEGVSEKRVHIIPNWADGGQIIPVAVDHNPLREEWGLGGHFVIGYSGNLGRAHEFDTILEAMKSLLRDDLADKLSFVFIGGGAQHTKLQRDVRDAGLNNVHFYPYQSREKLGESLSVADLHLVSLQPEIEGLIVPSKFYGIAAVGRATAYVGDLDGEIPLILSEADCGFTVRPGEGAELARLIRELSRDPERCKAMGERARSLFERNYDMQIAIRKWETLLNELS